MHIRPMTHADVPHLASLILAAFWDEPLYHYLFAKFHDYPEDFRRMQILRLKKLLVTPGSYNFVAVDDSKEVNGSREEGRIMGFAIFQYTPGKGSYDERARKRMKDSGFNSKEAKRYKNTFLNHQLLTFKFQPNQTMSCLPD